MSSASNPSKRITTLAEQRRGASARIGAAEVHSQRFAVEFDRRTVGIAVRVPGGFMFFSSTDHFNDIDGRVFRRVRALERELGRVARRSRRAAARERLSPV
jgi:hypothetical protein